MWRECHRVLKPGGRIAGYVIHTVAGLAADDEQRASALGPPHVAGSTVHLAWSGGFCDVTLQDVTDLFRSTCEALLEARDRWKLELRAELGNEEYAERRGRGDADRHSRRVAAALSGRRPEAVRIGSVDAEGEQHVARAPAEHGVPGGHVDHSVDDDRPWPVDRSALRLDAVDGVVLAVRVVLPEHRSSVR